MRSNGRCGFVYADRVGDYFPGNHSYNGAIGLTVLLKNLKFSQLKSFWSFQVIWLFWHSLQIEGKADVFIRPTDLFSIDQSLVAYSDVLLSIAYHPFQLINKKNQSKKSLAKLISFLIPSFSFLLIFVLSLIFYLADLFLFSLASSRLTSLKRLRTFKITQQKLKGSRLKILTFSFMVFVFFIKNFFGNNLNTTIVILDFSDLLYSIEKLLETDKEFCFLERSIEYEYFERVRQAKICFLLINTNAFPGSLPRTAWLARSTINETSRILAFCRLIQSRTIC